MRRTLEDGYRLQSAFPPPPGVVEDGTFDQTPRPVFQTPAMTADIQRIHGDRTALWSKDVGGKGDWSRASRGPQDWVSPQPLPERDMYNVPQWCEESVYAKPKGVVKPGV